MGGGAWPFLVGGVICLVNSDNERDSVLLNRRWLVIHRQARLVKPRASISLVNVGVGQVISS